ncbi:hypothetical protein ACFYT4_35625 [Streptomyces sp. NPDC004609]|uniref:hypothetical protein n=1 Tax=Streptomyces sp. NPDC004609 TaxID=3364704 RepID=UPI0036B78489
MTSGLLPSAQGRGETVARHQAGTVAIGLWYHLGVETEYVAHCPACGKRSALGHGPREDARFCGPACRRPPIASGYAKASRAPRT